MRAGDTSEDDTGGEVDQRRLQLYERAKLRYYYAIAEFGSAAAAAHVYVECDGLEFERSANRCAWWWVTRPHMLCVQRASLR